MTHTVDYDDAAKRHYNDARLLRESGRLPNTDHLLGLATECGLKCLMVRLGVAFQATEGIDKRYQVHVNKLWNEAASFAQTRQGAAVLSALVSVPNPFAEWRVHERYLAEASHPARDAERIERHANAAAEVLKAMEAADGLGGAM